MSSSRQSLIFEVEGMKCGSCSNKIEAGLKDIDGIENTEIELSDKTVKITASNSLSTMTIKKEIEELGFSVTKMSKV